MSFYDVHALDTQYSASYLQNILKRNPTGVYHHSANNVGCVDEDVHLEPCCSDSSSNADDSSIRNAASDRQYSSCADLRASQFSPEACSYDTLVEWLPRIHTSLFPYIQQFDNVQELMNILTELAENDGWNLQIRQAMRMHTMELNLHNSGKNCVMCVLLCISQLTLFYQILQFVSQNRSGEKQAVRHRVKQLQDIGFRC
jgi:hypothetical protein